MTRMSCRLRDTRSKELIEIGADGRPIGIYVCGVTPYDRPHLGHARAAVVFDALVRFLRHEGRAVTYVRNITDIDDKIIERAGGGDCVAFTAPHIAAYHAMAAALGCLPPDVEPRVSTHIPEIIALVERLVERGHAYPADGSVYFGVRSFPSYGELSGRAVDDLLAGARIEPGVEKRDPLDFALWKSAKPGEPRWSSPWGEGRPGWHIECSAMAMKHLGETVEIHGGGNDLVFPHHENERAQSEAATGRPYVRAWMHNGMITLDRRKMAKSEGNVLDPMGLIERHGSRVVRFALLNAHYASPIDFAEERLIEAHSALERFATFAIAAGDAAGAAAGGQAVPPAPGMAHFGGAAAGGQAVPPAPGMAHFGGAAPEPRLVESFRSALASDFNLAAAFSVLFEAVRAANRDGGADRPSVLAAIRACGAMIGIDLLPLKERDTEIERLIEDRARARAARDFAAADAIRKDLSNRGVIIEDTPTGTIWRR